MRPAEPAERVLLYGHSAQLSGILTWPSERAADRPAVVIVNAGILHKAGPNRIHVRLARRLAARGIPVFRFDFAGVGDSRVRSDGRTLSEGVLIDVRETLDHLQRHYDLQQFIVMGLCSGADNALRAARQDDRIVGIVLLDPTTQRTRRWYWEHYSTRTLSPDFWRRVVQLKHPRIRRFVDRLRGGAEQQKELNEQPAKPRPELFRTGLGSREIIEQHFQDVLKRQVQVFYAISGGWASLYNYREQLFDLFPNLDFGSLLRLQFYPHAEHTFDLEAHRQALFEDLLDWVLTASFVMPKQRAAKAPAERLVARA